MEFVFRPAKGGTPMRWVYEGKTLVHGGGNWKMTITSSLTDTKRQGWHYILVAIAITHEGTREVCLGRFQQLRTAMIGAHDFLQQVEIKP